MLEIKELSKDQKFKILNNLITYKHTLDIQFELLRSNILRQPMERAFLRNVQDCTNLYYKIMNNIADEEYSTFTEVKRSFEELTSKLTELLKSLEGVVSTESYNTCRDCVDTIKDVTNAFVKFFMKLGDNNE